MAAKEDTPYRKALLSALRILARRDHSVEEISQKLSGRGYDENVVRKVIAECRRLDYLDDARAAAQLVDGLHRKGFGIRRIRQELYKRGLAGECNEGVVRERMSTASELEGARRALAKKWKALSAEPDPGRKRMRLQRFLLSRGFSEAVVFEATRGIDAGDGG
jgi:regulatory protein